MQIDKKLCVCYAENNLSVKIKYLRMSIEKGVAVKETVAPFLLERRTARETEHHGRLNFRDGERGQLS